MTVGIEVDVIRGQEVINGPQHSGIMFHRFDFGLRAIPANEELKLAFERVVRLDAVIAWHIVLSASLLNNWLQARLYS